MSAPPPYVVFNDYSDYQTSHQLPGPALQGSDLDVEFQRLKATTDALINNLGLIQRSDGALNNQLVTPDSISSALAIMIAGWNIRGAWVTATAYALKDYVTNGGNGYVCIVAHTAGTFATDLAAGKWSIVATAGSTGMQGPTGPQGPSGVMPPLRGYIGGLTLTNNVTTPNTKIDVAAGMCADDTNVTILNLTALTIDATVVGANGIDFAGLGSSTWYHVFVIGKVDGTTAGIISTNQSTPIMPSGYVYKRRMGIVKTDGSSHLIAFKQDGDIFSWATPVTSDYFLANPGTAAVTATLPSIPTGVRVGARIIGIYANSDATLGAAYFSDLSTADVAPSASFMDGSITAAAAGGAQASSSRTEIFTNTLGQIRYRTAYSSANTSIRIDVLGWRDRRGQDA